MRKKVNSGKGEQRDFIEERILKRIKTELKE